MGEHDVGDNCFGAEGEVEAPDGVVDHITEEEFQEALERKAMDGGAGMLLDCVDRPLDLANVAAVCGDDIDCDRKEVGSDAFELGISVYVPDN